MAFLKWLFIQGLLLITLFGLYGQDVIPSEDTLIVYEDIIGMDSVVMDSIVHDTIGPDSLSLRHRQRKGDAVDAKVDYKSADTMIFDLTEKTIYLHNDAQVIYKDIQLDAAYIEFDMANNEVFARGKKDTLGQTIGKPAFKDGSQSFDANDLRYNFKTKKGLIRKAISPQEGGYLHADITKKQEDGTIHVKDGKYTTCDLEHPHFYIAMTKAKVIPDDKIVSGPAYLVVEDVPLYFLGIPFGFFPNTKSSKAGVLIPSYGEEKIRGFYLRRGGWYMPVNEYMDLQVTADVYSKGSWGVRGQTRYVKRYKFNGSFEGNFNKNVYGDKGLPDYNEKKDYSIAWHHAQNEKANPTRDFSANVNISSSSYDRNNSYSTENYLTNQKNSSIAYSKNWPGTPFYFDANMNYSQNSVNKTVDIILPSASFRVNRIFPFKSKKSVGKPKWYEQIQLSYSSDFRNEISTYDSLVFTEAMFEDMKNGYTHSVPLSTNFKFLQFFNLSPGLTYKGVIYGSKTIQYYDSLAIDPETGNQGMVKDSVIDGLNYVHAVTPNISLSVDPTIYGMYQVKNPEAKVIAVRHVMKPSARFSFTPDMNKLGLIPKELYYDTLRYTPVGSTNEVVKEYSYYEGYIYGTPLAPGRSGSVSFSLRNNVEMKVRTPKDTTQDEKKVKVIDVLDFTTSYNPFAPENTAHWSPVTAMASNSYFNSKLNIRLTGNFDQYKLDSAGVKDPTGKPWETLRFTNGTITVGTSFKSPSKKDKQASVEGEEDIVEGPIEEEDVYNEYVDFNVPWDVRVDYSYNYSKPGEKNATISQTLGFSGNLSITPKWKIGFRSGYDIQAKEFTYTSFNVFRDLHCWEMRFSVVPFGYRQNYNFVINIKTAILRDLKYEKKQNWHDRAQF